MSTGIKGYVEELKSLKKEISLNRKKNKELGLRVKQIERYISQYLANKGHPGVKMNTIAVVMNEKVSRPKKKKSDCHDSQVDILIKNNISNPEQLLTQLKEATLTSPKKSTVLKIHNIKN